MSARFCGRCNKLLDDTQCPHCGMQTEPMSLTPPWVEDYEQDQMEDDFENSYTEVVRVRPDSLRFVT